MRLCPNLTANRVVTPCGSDPLDVALPYTDNFRLFTAGIHAEAHQKRIFRHGLYFYSDRCGLRHGAGFAQETGPEAPPEFRTASLSSFRGNR